MIPVFAKPIQPVIQTVAISVVIVIVMPMSPATLQNIPVRTEVSVIQRSFVTISASVRFEQALSVMRTVIIAAGMG
jgi:hypothetical protein